jgi:hypothetical protein
MERSAEHVKAIEILETQGEFECCEYLAGKITTDQLGQIVRENRYDRWHRGMKNLPFENCLASVVFS